MKNALSGIIIYQLFIFIVFFSCQSVIKQDSVEDFIPGTYIRNSQTEYGKIYDTIIVSIQNANTSPYKIEMRWRYDRVLDGKPDPEYKKEATTGIYDGKTKRMQDQHTCNYYSFDADKSLLFIGTNQYNKVR